jgi:competence protein ComEC
MAAGTIAALLAPFGLAAPAFWVMDISSRWILFVAHRISELEGSVTAIVTPSDWVVSLLALGGLWGVLWSGRGRILGVFPVALAFGLWAQTQRPDLFISGDGALAGLLLDQGRAISNAKGGGFTAQTWLENDGDLAVQEDAAKRGGFEGAKGARSFRLGPWRGVILTRLNLAENLSDTCATVDIIVVLASIPPETPNPGTGQTTKCLIINRDILDKTGTLAVWATDTGLEFIPSRVAPRIWSGPRPVMQPFTLAVPNSEKLRP